MPDNALARGCLGKLHPQRDRMTNQLRRPLRICVIAMAVCVTFSSQAAKWKKEPGTFRGVPWSENAAGFKRAFGTLDCRGRGLKSTTCYVDSVLV